MRRFLLIGFFLYWLIVIFCTVFYKTFTHTKFNYLYGWVFPRKYNMFTDFYGRKEILTYYFYNQKDTLVYEVSSSIKKHIKEDFPLCGTASKSFSKVYVNNRKLLEDYVGIKLKIKTTSKKRTNPQLDSMSLLLNKKENKNLSLFYYELRKVIIKLESIDTLKYPNSYYTLYSLKNQYSFPIQKKIPLIKDKELILSH